MVIANVKFSPTLSQTDPQTHPVLIIGQLKNLAKVKYSQLQCKLEPRVTEELYQNALSSLHPSPTDTCPLYLNHAILAALPVKCSRHNTPSRSHAITKIVKATTVGVNESIVMVCEREDLFASACAISRAFPLYSAKGTAAAANCEAEANVAESFVNGKQKSNETLSSASSSSSSSSSGSVTVTVEFVLVSGSRRASADTQSSNGKNDVEPITPSLTSDEINALQISCDSIRLAARIVDAPCNQMNVSHFLYEVQRVGLQLGVPCRIIRGEELQEKGFGGIYGVGKAASVPPALAVLSYMPPGARETIAWVGKGIVYDTGGLSIKGKTMMPGMKRDCGGAAGILGAFQAAVHLGFTENLHAVFCLAENAVGPTATRPDDVHTLYSGRSVEINNTDAEGRLVLADGVSYAHKDLNASIILDMATLTGAQGIATGKHHGAVLTNTQEWEEVSVEAGKTSGDLVFPVPYCPELHFAEFSSAIADMKNSVADRNNAQTSCAGLFVAAHLGFDFPGAWVHIDMAYPVHCGERATGYGVSLLLTMFGQYSNSHLLKSISPELSCIYPEDNNCKRIKRV